MEDLSGAGSWLSCLRLATNCHTHNVTVRRRRRPPCAASSRDRVPPPLYELVTVRAVRPGDQLAVWFDAELGQLAGVPFLGLRNIHGKSTYPALRWSKPWMKEVLNERRIPLSLDYTTCRPPIRRALKVSIHKY